MKKIIQIICFAVIVCCFVSISAVAAGNYLMPGAYRALEGAAPDPGKFFSIAGIGRNADTSAGSGEGELRLLGVLPVKNVRVNVEARKKLVVCGSVFALRMFTQGVNVVELDAVLTDEGEKRPALEAGFMKGDVITSVNGAQANGVEMIGRAVADSGGNAVVCTVRRSQAELSLTLYPACDKDTGRYKAGLWLRDSAAGIGTMTFYDEECGVWVGLGHCVSDADTGLPLRLRNGDVLNAAITGVRKGGGGQAGELTGTFVGTDVIGDIRLNSDRGIYGFLNGLPVSYGEYELAEPEEIETGAAEIITCVDNDGPKAYSVEIKKIITSGDNRNMIVHVTDSRLLAVSGGIVQGMSGSPLLQNGRLIGAVTHVLLDDSSTGYAIFAKTMYDAAQSVAETRLGNAA